MSVKVSTCRKKKIKYEKTAPPYGMKNSFKNTFPLDKKYLSLAGASEKCKKLTFISQKISFH